MEFYYVQANFPNEGWRDVFTIPFKTQQAYESLYYGKRDNPELEYRLVDSESGEVISQDVAIKAFLDSQG